MQTSTPARASTMAALRPFGPLPIMAALVVIPPCVLTYSGPKIPRPAPIGCQSAQFKGKMERIERYLHHTDGVTCDGSKTNVACDLTRCGVDVTLSRNLDSSSLVRVWSGVAGSQSYHRRGGDKPCRRINLPNRSTVRRVQSTVAPTTLGRYKLMELAERPRAGKSGPAHRNLEKNSHGNHHFARAGDQPLGSTERPF
jgi:hypothetical protein